MKAMILSAGLGTRLRPLTDVVPKPMVQLAGSPCLKYTAKLLNKHGVLESAVNLHYKPEIIKAYLGNGSKFGLIVEYSMEDKLMGTAGGFKKLQIFFENDTTLIISGDALTDIDIQDFYRFHKKKGTIATLALKGVTNPSNYGVVKLNRDSVIEIFQEKPSPGEAVSSLANTGIYLFEPEILDYIPPDSYYDFGKDLFPLLINEKIDIAGYMMEGYWCDIGDLEIYKEANYDLLNGRVKVDLPGKRHAGNIWTGSGIEIHPRSFVKGPLFIGDNCVIEEGAEIIGPSVLGDNSIMKKGSLLRRSILWNNVRLGKGVHLEDSIVGEGVHLREGSFLKGEVLIKS